MYVRESLRLTLLLILLCLASLKKMTNGDIILDCGDSNSSCPNTDVTMNCVSSMYLLWVLPGGDEIEFIPTPGDSAGDSVGDLRTVTVFDTKFQAVFVSYNNGLITSTLTFNSILVPKFSKIECKGFSVEDSEQCVVSHQDPPSSVSNLTGHIDLDLSTLHLSWSAPSDLVNSNNTPQYKVIVTPPSTTTSNNSVFTTSNNLTIDVSSYQLNVQYAVVVTTVICNGSLSGDTSSNYTFTLSLSSLPDLSTIQPSHPLPTLITPSSSLTIATTTTHITHAQLTINSIHSKSSTETSTFTSTTSSRSLLPTSDLTAVTANDPREPTTDDTTNDDTSHVFFYGIIGIVVGAVIVLVSIVVILIVFAIIVIVIVKNVSNKPSSSCPSHSSDQCTSHPPPDISAEQAVVALNPRPPSLPPSRLNHKNFKLKAITGGPLYDNPQSLWSQSISDHNRQPPASFQEPTEHSEHYSIPIFARVFIPAGNSQSSFV